VVEGVQAATDKQTAEIAEYASATPAAEEHAAQEPEEAAAAEAGVGADISMEEVLGRPARKRPLASTEEEDVSVETQTF
jgi:hypothetical protein